MLYNSGVTLGHRTTNRNKVWHHLCENFRNSFSREVEISCLVPNGISLMIITVILAELFRSEI